MTIKPCKECGAPVSDKADACPMCGAKVKKMGIFLKIILWFFGIMIFFCSCRENRWPKQA
nr:zinc-ribbon domain-containing protein [Acinetobacter baumannii]